MAIKIGDKVRFLNSIGGGTVKGFQGKNIVLVEEEDGFETPALITDVVVVAETNQYNFAVNRPAEPKNETKKPDVNKEKEYTMDDDYETPEGEQLSLFLAFVPVDYKHPGESEFDIYLVNDSNYYMSFCIAMAGERMKVRYNDTLEPQTKLWLEKITADDLNAFQSLRVQAFAYKKCEYDFKPAIDTPLRLNLQRFFKMHSFVENDFFDEPALLESIVRQDFSIADVLSLPTKEQKPKPQRERISKPNAHPDMLEIDLHINALIDNTNGLTPKDMLDYQMEKFNEVMHANIKRKGTRIVFIHGKGEGALRAEILRQLKKNYQSCDVQDANFQKYGFGASMVTIH
ncbi:MAG: DUF2027 domain-containing protein [Paludibacteraceae bacterium]|nr:DUF2027 domain-containing protein [Paludibacteraceae bacterium]